jgi:hypothetical protein
MRGKLLFSSMMALLLVISLISTNASALDADQKSVILTVEAGRTIYFDIYMSGGGSADITHSGDINRWVSHVDTVSSGEWLEVKIEVPGDADPKSYSENILADGATITKITVVVTSPVSGKLNTIQNKIEDMIEEQDDLETYLENKLDETNAKITSIEIFVSDLKDVQMDLSEAEERFSADKQIMQQLISNLESDNNELETENEQLNSLTGMMSVNWSSAGFALGVIFVIVILVLYFKIGPKVGRMSMPKMGARKSSKRRHEHEKEEDSEPEDEAIEGPPSGRKPTTHQRIRGHEEFSYSFKGR